MKYITPKITFEKIENSEVICTVSVTAEAPDMPSGQPCGCDCPCDQTGNCQCYGCSPNDPCTFFDEPCL